MSADGGRGKHDVFSNETGFSFVSTNPTRASVDYQPLMFCLGVLTLDICVVVLADDRKGHKHSQNFGKE